MVIGHPRIVIGHPRMVIDHPRMVIGHRSLIKLFVFYFALTPLKKHESVSFYSS